MLRKAIARVPAVVVAAEVQHADRRGVHDRVTAAETGFDVVGDLADQRIDDGVDVNFTGGLGGWYRPTCG